MTGFLSSLWVRVREPCSSEFSWPKVRKRYSRVELYCREEFQSVSTTKRVLDLPTPGVEPAVIRAEIRGTIYTFTEMEIGEYNDLLKKATKEEDDPDNEGEKIEVVDNTILTQLMIKRSVSPVPNDQLMRTGTRMYRAFAKLVSELHYGDEPVKIINDEDEDEAESEKEDKETPGN
jgi:hypothetical protein